MDNEPLPTQLNADYYRRKNFNIMACDGGPKIHDQLLPPEPQQKQLQVHATSNPKQKPFHGIIHRLATKLGSFAGRSLRVGGAVVGIAFVASAASYYYDSKQVDNFFGASSAAADDDDDDDDDDNINNKSSALPPSPSFKKRSKYVKRVLVLPFDNLKVIEHRKSGSAVIDDLLSRVADPSQQPTITIEAKELVNILHSAASNPNICALYATFGEGDGLGGMRHPIGSAHLEEIRNAVRIFNESHRVHRDPNIHHNPVYALARNGDPKQSYAFGHAFQWREYFLASAFTNVHLQSRGHLHLFGVTMNNLFLGGMLDKYGIKAHVFRHGEYKNAPSIFTDKKYSKSHLETVQAITSSVNDTFRNCIENSRVLKFDNVMWQSIFDYGSLRAANSTEIGLVDYTPPVDPLISLLNVNRCEAKKKQKKSFMRFLPSDDEEGEESTISNRVKFDNKFGMHESFSKFSATEAVSLVKYKQMLYKKERVEQIRMKINNILHRLSETSTATSFILSSLNIKPDKSSSAKSDKVAVVTVDGTIGSSLSYEIIHSLRKIRKDKGIKAVVLRVNSPGGSVVSSEAILEEIKLLDKPVICSMSNAAASGGYYIAMNSEKVFANSTTLTGSIGVFGIKFDASKWANGYGITGDYYPHGSHGAALNPLTPLTPSMKNNISRIILDYYDYFKGIVSIGRSLSINEVEAVAQGRVWTGEQAKEVGLVDAIGGLDRAVSYAKRTHTNTDHVEVHHYPRRLSLFDDRPDNFSNQQLWCAKIVQSILTKFFVSEYDVSKPLSTEYHVNDVVSGLSFVNKPHIMLTMDEATAIDIILKGE